MTNTIEGDASTPLALHVRRHRQWYGDREITQKNLARLAGVSIHAVQRLEALRELQPTIETIIRLSLALGVPVTDLIAPDLIDEITADIEARREQLGLVTGKSDIGYRPDAA